MLRLLPTLVLLGACAADPFAELEIDGATIFADGASHGMAGIVGGYGLSEDATLILDASDGTTWSAPVKLEGPLLGVGGELGFSFERTLEFDLPGGDVRASDLMGLYTGSLTALGLGIGLDALTLENSKGVRIEVTGVSMSLGIAQSWALLSVIPEGDPEPSDEG